MRAQQPITQAVEGTDPHGAGVDRHDRADAPHHFTGGLVGESDCENTQRAGVSGLDQPGDTRREHPRLAATGTGQHQGMRGLKSNGLSLGRIELFDHAA